MDYRDEIEMWAKKWDAAQEKWAKETPQAQAPNQKADSFFGLQTNPVPQENNVSKQQGDEWWSIYSRSGEIREEQPTDEDQMFQEQANGWRKLLGQSEKKAPRPQQQQAQNPYGKQSFQEQAEGWRKLLSTPGKDVKFQINPQYPPSIGMDQGDSPYEPTRVAPNFTDGKELRELSDLKVKLEKLESTLLSNEIKAGKANTPVSSYKTQLDRLRQQIDDLSDKLTPEPGRDVY